jgi:hypothetical protein
VITVILVPTITGGDMRKAFDRIADDFREETTLVNDLRVT